LVTKALQYSDSPTIVNMIGSLFIVCGVQNHIGSFGLTFRHLLFEEWSCAVCRWWNLIWEKMVFKVNF